MVYSKQPGHDPKEKRGEAIDTDAAAKVSSVRSRDGAYNSVASFFKANRLSSKKICSEI